MKPAQTPQIRSSLQRIRSLRDAQLRHQHDLADILPLLEAQVSLRRLREWEARIDVRLYLSLVAVIAPFAGQRVIEIPTRERLIRGEQVDDLHQ